MRRLLAPLFAGLVFVSGAMGQGPVGSGFTYQGKLLDGGQPATGTYDLMFRLYESAAATAQVGDPYAVNDVAVAGGVFTCGLNFGSVYDGSERWLAISVRPGSSTGAYTALTPLQKLTPAPYAVSAQKLSVPTSASGATDMGLIPSGLFRITQNGTSNAIFAVNSSTGAAFWGENTGTGDGLRIHANGGVSSGAAVNASSTNFRAGTFEIDNAASPHIALFGTTNGTGVAVEGYSTGVAKAVAGYSNGPQGQAGYFRVGNNANTAAALYAETVGNGPALYAKAGGVGPALEIADGHIRVTGAGVNTATPVFIHAVSPSSRTNCSSGFCVESVIDHPLCNNSPTALLTISEVAVTANRTRHAGVGSRYDTASGRWRVFSFGNYDGYGDLADGERFVVMVVKP